MKIFKTAILIIMIAVTHVPAYCQKSVNEQKIKSIVVTEEKSDMVKKQYKDSETYYDSNGNIIESITYKFGKVNKHFKYAYDSNNNKVREEELDPSGKIKEYSEYKYSNGFRTEKSVYDASKKLKSKKTYTYTTW